MPSPKHERMNDVRPAVCVTGGSRRLGAAIARAFGDAGWHVVIHHRGECTDARALAQTLPSAETVSCDLRDRTARSAMIADLSGRLRNWRALVCSAAVFERDEADSLDPDVFATAMAVNAEACADLVQRYFATAMAPLGRRAIVLTDQKLANPNPDFFSYTLSKHAIAGAVPLLAQGAARGAGDRVYALAPGAILASHDQDESEAEVSHRLNLLTRRTGADEIAAAAVFLADGHLASGQTLFVDSGQHLCRQPRDVIFLAREGATRR